MAEVGLQVVCAAQTGAVEHVHYHCKTRGGKKVLLSVRACVRACVCVSVCVCVCVCRFTYSSKTESKVNVCLSSSYCVHV